MPSEDQTALLPRVREEPPAEPMAPLIPESEEPDPARSAALAQLAWVAPTVVMMTIALLRISWPALWSDELASWGMATAHWSQMLPVLGQTDAVVGPYYFLLHSWASVFGDSDFSLRLPSAMAMSGAVAVTAHIGTRLGGRRCGLLAGLLLAVTPTMSRFAQEARPYAFAVLAVALATLALLRALEQPMPPRFVAYAAAITFVGLFHTVALLILACHLAIVLHTRRDEVFRWAVAASCGVVPLLPLLWLGQRQHAQVAWIPDVTFDRLTKLPDNLFGLGVLGGVVVGVALLSASLRHPALVFTAWAFLPTASLYLISQFDPLWLPRYLLFTVPGWALLAGLSLSRWPVVRGGIVVTIVCALAFPAQIALREQDGHSQGSRDIAALMQAYGQPGDAIVYGPQTHDEARIGRDIMAHYVPAAQRPLDVLVTKQARTAGNFRPAECPNVATCLGQPTRVWLLRVGSYGDPFNQLGSGKEQALRDHYSIDTLWRPTGLTVALLIRNAA